MVPFGDEVLGELAASGRFAGALEAGHHDDGGAGLYEVDARVHGAHQVDELFVDDLDHHLAGLEGLDDLAADRFLDDGLGEIADDFEIDVGVDQGAADFLHRFADVLFADFSAAGQRAEHAAEFVGKCIEHVGNNRRESPASQVLTAALHTPRRFASCVSARATHEFVSCRELHVHVYEQTMHKERGN